MPLHASKLIRALTAGALIVSISSLAGCGEDAGPTAATKTDVEKKQEQVDTQKAMLEQQKLMKGKKG